MTKTCSCGNPECPGNQGTVNILKIQELLFKTAGILAAEEGDFEEEAAKTMEEIHHLTASTIKIELIRAVAEYTSRENRKPIEIKTDGSIFGDDELVIEFMNRMGFGHLEIEMMPGGIGVVLGFKPTPSGDLFAQVCQTIVELDASQELLNLLKKILLKK